MRASTLILCALAAALLAQAVGCNAILGSLHDETASADGGGGFGGDASGSSGSSGGSSSSGGGSGSGSSGGSGSSSGASSGSSGGTSDAGADAGPSDAGADATDATDATALGDGSTPIGVALPFYVSDQFLPTGFSGSTTASTGAISQSSSPAKGACVSRVAGAGGECYAVTWSPTVATGGSDWASIYWQYPANNWGNKPGLAIAPGATKVSFYAAGAAGGEQVSFCAGGINIGGAKGLPYSDSFTSCSPSPVSLTASWVHYTLSLNGTAYTEVLGGFAWLSTATTSESITFYLDDIQWE